jgi:hypothetical protein
MAKKMGIEFERGGKFVATLREDEAPETTKGVWDALPIEVAVKHAAFSGQVFFAFVDFKLKKIEDPRCVLQPGDILFNTQLTPLGPANKPVPNEIAFVYGPYNFIVAAPGIPTAPNYFAKITEGSLEELYQIGVRVREKGMEKVTFKKKE